VLPEGSFFGEMPVLMGINTYFGLSAVEKNGVKFMKDGYEQIQLYACDKDIFKEICLDYPDFGNSVYIRAELRIAYFKHLASLRQGEFGYNMKVLDLENKMVTQSMFPED